MRKTRGFTLIEVMVVLSILAIVAILAYNFFGSTMQEARKTAVQTEVHKALVTISEALEKYYLDNGTFMSSALTDAERMDLLVQGGYLKSPLKVPEGFASQPDYWIQFWDNYTLDMAGGPNADMGVQTAYVSEETCDEWNARYAPATGGIQPSWSTNGAALKADGRYMTACYEHPSVPTNNYIRLVVSLDAGISP